MVIQLIGESFSILVNSGFIFLPFLTGSQDPGEGVDAEDLHEYRGRTYCVNEDDVRAVNAAIHLRRPLLLTGNPGCGKSSLAYAIAWRLKLGEVLYWPVNSQTTLKEGLYRYDAIARLRDANMSRFLTADGSRQIEAAPAAAEVQDRAYEEIERYLTLGPLGSALAPRSDTKDHRPRILLIDELDKSDVDLPNDLLNLFEEGSFDIDELVRIKRDRPQVAIPTAYRQPSARDEAVEIIGGHVQCREFPIVVITSNQERQFPPAFLRRCLRHYVDDADQRLLKQIIEQHQLEDHDGLVAQFVQSRDSGALKANDQLLSALFLLNRTECGDTEKLRQLILKDLKE